jgi:beta-phosphoglucomutase
VQNINYDAVLFDFDGVLADTEPVHWQCWLEIVRPFGIDLPWETYQRHCIGVSDRLMIETLAREASGPRVDFEALWSRYPAKKRLFRERIVPAKPISEPVIHLLKSLSQFKLAIVTSSGRSEVEPVLEAAGIRDCFDVAVFGGDVERLKPAPDPYLKAAELLNAARPLVVEDSDAGCESGRCAGFDVLRIPSAARTAELVRAHLGL